MFDSHAHLNFKDFKKDSHQIIKKCLSEQMYIINVGSQLSTSKRAVEFAEKYMNDNIYAAVGIHPTQLFDMTVEQEEQDLKFKTRAELFDPENYKKLVKSPKTVAFGEIGLDYHCLKGYSDELVTKMKKIQKVNLEKQIIFATNNNLPIIFHIWDLSRQTKAYDDLIKIVKKYLKSIQKKGAVVHCYIADWEHAKKFIDMGFYLGFTGFITYDEVKKISGGQKKEMNKIHETIKKMPLNRILVETDSPWLLPEPIRSKNNKQRNIPLYVKEVIRKISEIRDENFFQIDQATIKNAKKLFSIK